MLPSTSHDLSIESIAERYYKRLITFPSYIEVLTYLLLLNFVGYILFILLLCRALQVLIAWISLGFILASLFITDIAIAFLLAKKDPILTLRRISCLSLIASIMWIAFILVSGTLFYITRNLLISMKAYYLGLLAILTLRFIVFQSCSYLKMWKSSIATLTQPLIYFLFPYYFENIRGALQFNPTMLASTLIVAFTSAYIFLYLTQEFGRKRIGFGSVDLFRAFLATWTSDENAPLENMLERMGCFEDIPVTLLFLLTENRGPNVMLIVPGIHPGPFRNVGSSSLPLRLKERLEGKTGYFVFTPHSTATHKLDLVSQAEMTNFIDRIPLEIGKRFNTATRMVRASFGSAKATCQIFGDGALITLTLAPKETEDLPPELTQELLHKAREIGLNYVAVIDAHNSVNGERMREVEITDLKRAALKAMMIALNERKYPFKIGVTRIIPKEFTIEQGMGPCGISVLAIKTGKDLAIYVLIDGNNMLANLREDILSDIRKFPLADGEVLTTDTHIVNGVVLTNKGYYPVGKAISHKALRKLIIEAISLATSNLVEATAAWNIAVIPKVRVIGSRTLRNLHDLIVQTMAATKRMALCIFPLAFILEVLILISI